MVSSYTNTSLVQAELRLSTEFSADTFPTDDTVNIWINQASRQVELMSNTIFTSTAVSSQLFDWPGISTVLNLPVSDLISITKVEENINGPGVAPSWTTLREGMDTDYIVYPDYNEIEFVRGVNSVYQSRNIYPVNGKQKLRISYTYGYATTPLEVQYLTTLLVAKRVIQSLGMYQANTKMGQVTVGPVSVADPSQFSINYMKFLNDEITKLSEDIAVRYKTFKFTTRVYEGPSNYGYF